MALASLAASAALWWPAGAAAARIKEVAAVQGVRTNQLVGYGLVVGLDGTGEQNAVTAQSLTALLQSMGVTLPPGVVAAGPQRRRGDGDGRAAGLRAAGADDRHQRVVDGQRQEPARRHADR